MVQLTVSGALGALFGAPLGAVALSIEGQPPRVVRDRVKRAGPAVVAALAALWVLLHVLPEGTLHPFVVATSSSFGGLDLLWWALAAVAGAGGGWVLHTSIHLAEPVARRRLGSPVLRAGVGGLVLGACGALTPLSLFSGHHETQALLDRADHLGALALVGICLVKIVAVTACLATGWFGGEVFPAAMVGAALGLAVAAVTGAGTATSAASGMVADAAVMLRRPVAALLLLIFFLPAGTLIAATLGAAAGSAVLAIAHWPKPDRAMTDAS